MLHNVTFEASAKKVTPVFQSSQHILDDESQLVSDGFSGTYKNGCLLFLKAADGTPPDLQSYQNVMDTYCT
jgi:hypothetical protein